MYKGRVVSLAQNDPVQRGPPEVLRVDSGLT